MRQAGLTSRIAEVAREGHTIIGLMAAGASVFIVPETLGVVSRDAVVFWPVACSSAWLEMYVAWRCERSPTVTSFVDVARSVGESGVLPHFGRQDRLHPLR